MADIVGRIVEIEGPIHAERGGDARSNAIRQGSRGSRIAGAALMVATPASIMPALREDEDSGLRATSATSVLCATAPTAAGSLQKGGDVATAEIRAAAMKGVRRTGELGETIAVASRVPRVPANWPRPSRQIMVSFCACSGTTFARQNGSLRALGKSASQRMVLKAEPCGI